MYIWWQYTWFYVFFLLRISAFVYLRFQNNFSLELVTLLPINRTSKHLSPNTFNLYSCRFKIWIMSLVYTFDH